MHFNDETKLIKITPVYWRMYHKYNIAKILEEHEHLAIQGEIAGYWDEGCRSSIQGNRLKLSESDLFVFDVFDIKEHRYYNFEELIKFCQQHGLKMVPIDNPDFVLDHTIEDLLKMAEGKYANGGAREGIVIRSLTDEHNTAFNDRVSFKVINNKFLLKHGG
jgi:ATP-dependent RNA circularization protein (DNA/RNA ligase family)